MTIDLCVVTYNNLDKLQRLVKTLLSDYEPDVFTLRVQDNGDGSAFNWLLSYEDEPLYDCLREIYHNPRNPGYAEACNRLASAGSSEFLALLNDDVWLTTADVKAIERSFNESEADILGPKQRDEDGRIRHGGIFGTNTAPKFRGWARPDPDDVLYRGREGAVTVSGSAYFVRRSVWDALTDDPEYRKLVPDAKGAFLPTTFYYEETWCSYFARHRGYKLLYDGTVSIGHTWHGSHDKNDYLDRVTVKESRAMFRTACDFMGIPRD